jgi:hemolysin III
MLPSNTQVMRVGTGFWSAATANRLRALDHANIFALIAGTYTPLCSALLSGWLKLAILALPAFLKSSAAAWNLTASAWRHAVYYWGGDLCP